MRATIQITLLSMFISSTACLASTNLAQNETATLKISLERFLSVACNKTGHRCLAVGFGKDSKTSDRLVYITQDAGKTWSEPSILAPVKDEKLLEEESSGPHSASISCDAYAQRCTIVSAALLENVPKPIVYKTEDGGLTWSEPSVLTLPEAVNTKLNFNYPSAINVKISCSYSAYTCVIAGSLLGGEEYTPLLYVTHDGGREWNVVNDLKLVSSTPKVILHGTSLTDVHCDNSGYFCTVAGKAITKNSYWSYYYSFKPIVYTTHSGGARWSKPEILPTEVTDYKTSGLSAVSCSDMGTQCTAIGFTIDYQTHLYEHFSFTTTNGGKEWEKRNLITSSKFGGGFNSIHCDDTGNNCTAVGWHNTVITATSVFKPLIYNTIDGAKNWTRSSEMSFHPFSSLKAVSCSSTGENCVAVGTQLEISMKLQGSKKGVGLDQSINKPIYCSTP